MFVCGNLMFWESKNQHVVGHSSVEAAYHAMIFVSCELIWLKNLLTDHGFDNNTPMLLFCDNQAATHATTNPMFHERTKHLEVDCHFIHQQV